ncbi:CHAP domain-containing protein [Rubritalea tangerina]|uniref:CHAP domain-containing protein n=2 Tax=Rubritalea tangerina TaxID=430798 RepID=A0ABW4Z6J6_9BACT
MTAPAVSSKPTLTLRIALSSCALVGIGLAILYLKKKQTPPPPHTDCPPLGSIVHYHKGIPIYSNGLQAFESHGKHYAADGYYYGHKWQCVEFIKRYFHDAHKHHMPNVWGHAKDYFHPELAHGALNPDRNMLQFHNGSDQAPQVNDLLVWNNPPYGHVAIIAEVHHDHIVVAQQNIIGAPTQRFPLTHHNGSFTINDDIQPAGWLRLP